MGAHQSGPPAIFHGAAYGCARRRKRIAFPGDQVEIVALPRAGDARLHAAPEQHPVVRRLTATARVEGRSVEHDPVRCRLQDDGIPFPQGLIIQLKPVRPPLRLAHGQSLVEPGANPAPARCWSYQGP